MYEEQVKSGYRLPLHPFALPFFEHYHMALGYLVPNNWRKLVRLIYLVETSGYKADPTDFMRVFFEIYFIKGVANCPGWYYIHSKPTPNNLTKHILSDIKHQGGLSVDEPLSEQQLEYRRIIPHKLVPMGLSALPPPPATPSASSTEFIPLGVLQIDFGAASSSWSSSSGPGGFPEQDS
ncbi:hypothetical protein RJ639_009522 [Escallonia herrerae]|uniref:Transposase (putative) gypsy type domain-containing protein n=1 Tax=Escallonia herrerae TaxID=1293975 RepID=A0AA88VY85_9ASTE|nr:hypothetical protein RJ639_009522 [Escallonia herrerae]